MNVLAFVMMDLEDRGDPQSRCGGDTGGWLQSALSTSANERMFFLFTAGVQVSCL
jgi:hypothetical protein